MFLFNINEDKKLVNNLRSLMDALRKVFCFEHCLKCVLICSFVTNKLEISISLISLKS